MNYQDFIKPELLILIPVIYFIGVAIKKSKIKDCQIPLILGGISILLSGLYLFATEEIKGTQEVATAIFTALTQGILIAAASVYSHQIIKQIDNNDEQEERE